MSKRNFPCECGSGRKAKVCCLKYVLPPPVVIEQESKVDPGELLPILGTLHGGIPEHLDGFIRVTRSK